MNVSLPAVRFSITASRETLPPRKKRYLSPTSARGRRKRLCRKESSKAETATCLCFRSKATIHGISNWAISGRVITFGSAERRPNTVRGIKLLNRKPSISRLTRLFQRHRLFLPLLTISLFTEERLRGRTRRTKISPLFSTRICISTGTAPTRRGRKYTQGLPPNSARSITLSIAVGITKSRETKYTLTSGSGRKVKRDFRTDSGRPPILSVRSGWKRGFG